MSISAYVKNLWANGGPPAISETTLGNIDNQIEAISKEFTDETMRATTAKTTIVGTDEVAGNNSESDPTFKWVRWTWNTVVTFLKTALSGWFSPAKIDTASRIADYTADKTPEIPDDVSGVTYLNNRTFTTADGWTASNCTLSYSNGRMILTATAANPSITRAVTASRMVEVRGRKVSGAATASKVSNSTGTVFTETKTYISNTFLHSFYIGSGATGNIQIFPGSTASASGDVYEIDFIYIGTGLYSTRTIDRSGNGWNLLNTACVPTQDKFGKSFLLNGATSFLRTEQYFAMPPIFTFMCRWSGIENLGTDQELLSLRSSTAFGLLIRKQASSTTLGVYYWNGTSLITIAISSFFTGTEHNIALEVDRSSGAITVYKDGEIFGSIYTGLTIVFLLADAYLSFSSFYDTTKRIKGTLGNIQMHARALTADEHYRYFIDPTSVDSGVPPYPVLPVFADNTAAIAGNVQIGQEYRTSTGVKMVRY
jgi:hypothetical protein